MPKAEASRVKTKSKAPKSSAKRTTEIEDIFATAKGKGKPSEKVSSGDAHKATPTSRTPPQESPIVSKKERKPKSKLLLSAAGEPDTSSGKPPANDAGGAGESGNSRKRRRQSPSALESAPNVVVDPSTKIEAKARAPNKKLKIGTDSDSQQPTDADLRFADSRGSGPRPRTEEGFLIYKEDELGMTGKGGDTPLCPFDCDCCY
ncbi:hypothetical protein M407DRAFT_244371 [Tulasnella calospora MUT 4182]|uniref:DUF1764-domain-containing protein n=1 Tax=Tulasnella calospora MUT 4182 TaxID=1051891 RepID=A0A0C3Q640_9AGAM|nr:hypothetical protein M407DRAFT_244371 [Tulasnella calospora MUT 4182]